MDNYPPELPEEMYEEIASAIDDPLSYRNYMMSSQALSRRATALRNQKRQQFFPEEIIPQQSRGIFEYRRHIFGADPPKYFSRRFRRNRDRSETTHFEGYVVNGRPYGLWKYYARGRVMSETNYLDGVAHGPATDYYPSGNIMRELNYNNMKREGPEIEYYDSPEMIRKVEKTYRDGVLHGPEIEYYPNGSIRSTRIYKKGMNNGPWVDYDEHGRIVRQGRSYGPDLLEERMKRVEEMRRI